MRGSRAGWRVSADCTFWPPIWPRCVVWPSIPHMQGRGLGKQLVAACEHEAREIDLPALFAWTYQQVFFEKCGFTRIDKTNLHPKVWSECQRCAFFENCNEIAMLRVLT